MKNLKTYIIVLNWNGWKDTIKCLESVFKLNFDNYKVIVCDNNSDDHSLGFIKDWANGLIDIDLTNDECRNLESLYYPFISKPIKFREIDNIEFLKNINIGETNSSQLTLIQTGSNLGFAGGNNVGIKYALSRRDCEYIWLLNNDTVVDNLALTKLHERYVDSANPGICSSSLLYYQKPKIVQALGGARYHPLIGFVQHIGGGKEYISDEIDYRHVERVMDYPIGASMFVSKNFIEKVGLLSEDYFLYFEELDWAIRCKQLGYNLLYAKDSIVYHKEGASIGGNSNIPKQKSLTSEIYHTRNKIKITKKYFRYAIIPIYLSFFVSMINRIRRNQWDRLPIILRIIFTS